MLHVPLLAVPCAFAMLCAGMGGCLRWAASPGLGGSHLPRRLLAFAALLASLDGIFLLARLWASSL
eukprot:3573705-Alexandrium_andersonii.AAC.1